MKKEKVYKTKDGVKVKIGEKIQFYNIDRDIIYPLRLSKEIAENTMHRTFKNVKNAFAHREYCNTCE